MVLVLYIHCTICIIHSTLYNIYNTLYKHEACYSLEIEEQRQIKYVNEGVYSFQKVMCKVLP